MAGDVDIDVLVGGDFAQGARFNAWRNGFLERGGVMLVDGRDETVLDMYVEEAKVLKKALKQAIKIAEGRG